MMKRLAWLLLLTCPLHAAAADLKLDVHPDRKSGVYAPGQRVTWTVRSDPKGEPAAGKIKWVVRTGGLKEVSRGEAEFVDGVARVGASRPDPGTLLLEVRHRPDGSDRDVVVRGGAGRRSPATESGSCCRCREYIAR